MSWGARDAADTDRASLAGTSTGQPSPPEEPGDQEAPSHLVTLA